MDIGISAAQIIRDKQTLSSNPSFPIKLADRQLENKKSAGQEDRLTISQEDRQTKATSPLSGPGRLTLS